MGAAFWDCDECCVGSPADEWRQEGDGWTCPDCGRNIAMPAPHEDARPVTGIAMVPIMGGHSAIRMGDDFQDGLA